MQLYNPIKAIKKMYTQCKNVYHQSSCKISKFLTYLWLPVGYQKNADKDKGRFNLLLPLAFCQFLVNVEVICWMLS